MAILLCALRRMGNAWTQREYEESNFAFMVLCVSMIEIWVWIPYGQLFMM